MHRIATIGLARPLCAACPGSEGIMRFHSIFLSVSALLLSASIAFAEIQPMELTVTLGDPESAEMGVVGNAFKEYLEKASKGIVRVHLIYAEDGQDESMQFHKVQIGKLDMAVGGIPNLEPLCRKLGVLSLPYLFENVEQAERGTTGKAAVLLNSYALESGLRVLAWTYSGFRNISNSRHPITELKDIRKLRIRVPHSVVMLDIYHNFGALPSSVAWGMTYKALEHDFVDGQCCSYSMFKAMKFMDAGQKYLTELHYCYLLQPLVINEKFFSNVSPELQKMIVDAGKYAQQQSLKRQNEMEVQAKEQLQAAGLEIATLTDEPAWRAIALEKVWPEVADAVGGKSVINAYLKACDRPVWAAED